MMQYKNMNKRNNKLNNNLMKKLLKKQINIKNSNNNIMIYNNN